MTQLPKIVSARLAALGSSEHPDADLLTAFAEHTLGGSERDRVLHHLSGCSPCRQVIALALPEASTAAVPSAIPGRHSWLRTPMLRWGALAACIVVVAATALLRRHEQLSRPEVQVALKMTPPPAAASQAPNPTASVSEDAVSRSEMKAKRRRAAPPVQRPETAPQQMASTKITAQPPNVPGPANATSSDLTMKTETAEVQAEAGPAQSAPSARVDQALSARNSAAPAKSAPLFSVRPSTETAASTIGGAAKLTDFRPPSWRLSQDDGLPERSFASGQWEKVQVDHKTGFRAIAAHGMEVWVGGLGGLLYHSQDVGLHWTRLIPVADHATLTDDITGIDFADHMHGNVHTSGAQTWVTSDGGKTWEIQ